MPCVVVAHEVLEGLLAGFDLDGGANFSWSPITDSFFTATTYRGAFGSEDWTAGWANWDPQNTPY